MLLSYLVSFAGEQREQRHVLGMDLARTDGGAGMRGRAAQRARQVRSDHWQRSDCGSGPAVSWKFRVDAAC